MMVNPHDFLKNQETGDLATSRRLKLSNACPFNSFNPRIGKQRLLATQSRSPARITFGAKDRHASP